MLKKLTFTFAAILTLLITFSQSAIAQGQEYLAEEIEANYRNHNLQLRASLRGVNPEVEVVVEGNEPTGSLVVSGEPSYFQLFNRVKALKCSPTIVSGTPAAKRNSCSENAVYFGLNEAKSLAPGFYILGFENSIYPGFVQITAGEEITIELKKIDIADGSAKIYRNLATPIEQKKMFFSQYQMAKSFFSLAAYDFGDLYLRKFPLVDLMPNIEYSFCDSDFSGEMDPQASRLCRAYKSSSFTAMQPFFVFNSDSTHDQFVPRSPGDAFKYSFQRLLVSAPTLGAAHVNVFPGEYIVEKTVGGRTTKTSVSVSKDANGRTISTFGAE